MNTDFFETVYGTIRNSLKHSPLCSCFTTSSACDKSTPFFYSSSNIIFFLSCQKVYEFSSVYMTNLLQKQYLFSSCLILCACVSVFFLQVRNTVKKNKSHPKHLSSEGISFLCLVLTCLSQATCIYEIILNIVSMSSALAKDSNKQLHSHFCKNNQYWSVSYFGLPKFRLPPLAKCCTGF